MILTLLYALTAFCAMAIALGMLLLGVTLIKPLPFITTQDCGKIILGSLMGMIVCVTIVMTIAGAG